MARGPLARVYDAVTHFAHSLKAGKSVASGERYMARLTGPVNGVPGAQGQNHLWQIQQFQGWTYVCINFIAEAIASCRPAGVRVVGQAEKIKAIREKSLRAFVPQYIAKASAGAKPAAEEYEYLPPNHPLNKLLNDPNEPDIGYSVWYLAAVFFELTGDAYLYKHRGAGGKVTELWNIPTHWVRPVCLGTERLIDYYEINPFTRGGLNNPGGVDGINRIEPEDIIRIRKASPFHPLAAYSSVQSNAAEIDTYSQVTAVRYCALQNGAQVGGVLQAKEGSGELDDARLSRIESRFFSRFGGVFNFNRPLILEPGWSYVPSPQGRELEYIQTQDQLRKHIIAGFGLDEAYFMSGESTYAASIDNRRKMRMNVVNPRLELFAGTLSERLARDEFGDDLRVIYPEVPQQTHEELVQTYSLLNTAQAVTKNEMRSAFALEPIDTPGADELPQDPMSMGMDGQGWDGDEGLLTNDVVEDDEPTDEIIVDGE